MFWVVPVILHSSLMNFEANLGSLSLMTFNGSPNRGKRCWIVTPATPSAVILSLQGMNTAAFVQSWSMIVSIESYPCEVGSLVMKSSAMVSKGIASGFGNMGDNAALVGCVLILFC